jgi:hypothetical protein
MSMLFLTESDVRDLLPMADAIQMRRVTLLPQLLHIVLQNRIDGFPVNCALEDFPPHAHPSALDRSRSAELGVRLESATL